MELDRGSAHYETIEKDLGDPKISTADLWKMALSKGAQKDAVATIRYDQSGLHFMITGGSVFMFDTDASGKPAP